MGDSPPIPGGSRTSQWRKKRQREEEDDDVLFMNVVTEPNQEDEEPPQDNSDTIARNSSNLEIDDIPEQSDSAEEDQDSDSSLFEMEDLSQSSVEDNNEGGSYQDLHQESDLDEENDTVYDGSSSSSSEAEDEDSTFNINHASLQQPLAFHKERTAKESLLLDLALSIRHNLTYEATIQGLESKNILFGKKIFPTQKKQLWKVLGRNSSGMIKHIYCSKCKIYVGKKNKLGARVACPGCAEGINVNKAKYFVTVSLKKQLEDFLSRPNVSELLNYRENRKKLRPDAIEDIFDGAEYNRLAEKVDLGENDFTGVFNLDGCKISKNAKTSIYPVFVRLNEIKPQYRQKFLFLAAVFVDTVEPDMNTLLKPVVKELNRLATEGVSWRNKNQEVIQSRLFMLCFCVDGKARWQILNMNSHSGYYGCTYCTIKSVRLDTTHRFPAHPHEDMPPYQDRTDEGMRADMLEASNLKRQGQDEVNVRGHKGVTVLATLKHLDLSKGSAADDLHNLFECAVKVHVNLLLTVVPRVDKNMGYELLCDIIDSRMKKIKTPSCISRKPGSPKNGIRNRNEWKGTQWRDYLFYYGVPSLQGLLPKKYLKHFELLSKFGYILSMTSISNEELETAKKCIVEYLEKFEEYYGLHRTRLNIHALLHAIASVRNLGPYWVYTTFNFESWNAQLLKKVTSPNGIIWQIIMRHLFLSHLLLVCSMDPDVSDDIKEQIFKILSKKARRKIAEIAAEEVHVLGRPITRQPTDAERVALNNANLFPDEIRVFPKVIIGSVEYGPPTPSTLTDNSVIYTYDDTFCTILNVIGFEAGGRKEYGLLVMEHDVTCPFEIASHISCIRPHADIMYFLQCNRVRLPAVKVEVQDSTFIIPMPNTFGVD